MKITLVREDRAAPLWSVQITDDVRATITRAVIADHPDAADDGLGSDNTDEVAWAIQQGYPLAAAAILRGATETPAIGAALEALAFNGAHVPPFDDERTEWDASPGSDSVRCPNPGCGAPVFTELEYGCGNCRTSLVIDTGEMFDAYVECALWSSLDDNGESMQEGYGRDDIDPGCLDEMRKDCQDFAEANIRDLAGMDPRRAGHDFWLTRNGHGAGFWDRGLGEKGDRLTAAAKPYGGCDLLPTYDGKLYVS